MAFGIESLFLIQGSLHCSKLSIQAGIFLQSSLNFDWGTARNRRTGCFGPCSEAEPSTKVYPHPIRVLLPISSINWAPNFFCNFTPKCSKTQVRRKPYPRSCSLEMFAILAIWQIMMVGRLICSSLSIISIRHWSIASVRLRPWLLGMTLLIINQNSNWWMDVISSFFTDWGVFRHVCWPNFWESSKSLAVPRTDLSSLTYTSKPVDGIPKIPPSVFASKRSCFPLIVLVTTPLVTEQLA